MNSDKFYELSKPVYTIWLANHLDYYEFQGENANELKTKLEDPEISSKPTDELKDMYLKFVQMLENNIFFQALPYSGNTKTVQSINLNMHREYNVSEDNAISISDRIFILDKRGIMADVMVPNEINLNFLLPIEFCLDYGIEYRANLTEKEMQFQKWGNECQEQINYFMNNTVPESEKLVKRLKKIEIPSIIYFFAGMIAVIGLIALIHYYGGMEILRGTIGVWCVLAIVCWIVIMLVIDLPYCIQWYITANKLKYAVKKFCAGEWMKTAQTDIEIMQEFVESETEFCVPKELLWGEGIVINAAEKAERCNDIYVRIGEGKKKRVVAWVRRVFLVLIIIAYVVVLHDKLIANFSRPKGFDGTRLDRLDNVAIATHSGNSSGSELMDEDTSTWWLNYTGEGYIYFRFDEDVLLKDIVITNGRVDSEQNYYDYSRPELMDIQFLLDEQVCGVATITLDDKYNNESSISSFVDGLDDGWRCDQVRMHIRSSYEGKLYKGTCISEIAFIGDQIDITDEIQSIKVTDSQATSMLIAKNGNRYEVSNTVDGDINTCWQEGVQGCGVGQLLYYGFAEKTYLTHVCIVNGRVDTEEAYWNNCRAKEIKLIFFKEGREVGSKYVVLNDEWKPEGICLELEGYERCICDEVRVRILSAYTGNRYEDLCISEVAFSGAVIE